MTKDKLRSSTITIPQRDNHQKQNCMLMLSGRAFILSVAAQTYKNFKETNNKSLIESHFFRPSCFKKYINGQLLPTVKINYLRHL